MFNGVNIYFLLNLTTINYAGVDLSATSAISLSLPTAIALNSSGNLFLSTLRPNSMSKTKAVMRRSIFIISLLIQFIEITSNTILGFVENHIIGNQINVTTNFKLTQGPKIQDILKLKKPRKKFLLYLASKL